MKNKPLRIRDIISYSPYDYNTDNKFVDSENVSFDEEIFYKEFFADIIEFKDLRNSFDLIFNVDGEYETQLSILSGYSGCGKTTFINHYKRYLIQNKERGYLFKIISLIDIATDSIDDENLIKKAIREVLIGNIINTETLVIINNHKTIFRNALSKNTIFSIEQTYASLESSHSYEKKYFEVDDFIEKIDFREALFLYFLSFIINSKDSNFENFIFCFDNLDDLNIEYLSIKIWEDIVNVLDKLVLICRDTSLNLNIDVKRHLRVLFVMREANISIFNAQQDERIKTFVSNRRIISSGSVKEILERRIDFIKNNITEFHNINENTIYELLKILKSEDEFVKRNILPFVNFDYRRLFKQLIGITHPDENSSVNFLRNITFEKYQAISTIKENLSRGVLYYGLFLQAMKEKNHLEQFVDRNEICSPSRMILTIIFNLSYPKGRLPNDTETRNKKNPQEFHLTDLLNHTKDLYTPEELTTNLKHFFNIKLASWAHFITIYNIPIKDKKINFEVIEDIIEKVYNKIDLNKDEKTILNKIKIQLNAAGYAYLRYTITHFEYFSLLAYKEKEVQPLLSERKPLVAMLDFDYRNGKYEFEIIIEAILDLVAYYGNRSKEDFRKSFSKYTETTYLNDDCVYSFKGEEKEKKSFYISRVITTHITYIDDFRYYLFENKSFLTEIDKFSVPAKKNIIEINKYLIRVIKKYIEIYENGLYDISIQHSIDKVKSNINYIEKNEIYDKWVNISNK